MSTKRTTRKATPKPTTSSATPKIKTDDVKIVSLVAGSVYPAILNRELAKQQITGKLDEFAIVQEAVDVATRIVRATEERE